MAFHDPKTRAPKGMQPGVQTRTFWGENLMFSLVELDAACRHPHPQSPARAGGLPAQPAVSKPRLARRPAGSAPGQLFLVPGGVEHNVRAGAEPVRLVAAFTPVREDLKY